MPTQLRRLAVRFKQEPVRIAPLVIFKEVNSCKDHVFLAITFHNKEFFIQF